MEIVVTRFFVLIRDARNSLICLSSHELLAISAIIFLAKYINTECSKNICKCNIRKLEISEVISSNLFLCENFRYSFVKNQEACSLVDPL